MVRRRGSRAIGSAIRRAIGPAGPEVGLSVHPYDAFAKSWLGTMYAIHVLLGVTPGDRRRWAYRGFKPGATKRFLGGLKPPSGRDKDEFP